MDIIDISVPLSHSLPVWPGDIQIVLERCRALAKGDASNDSRLACSVHSGTHVDAPLHFFESGATTEELALDILIGPARIVELPEAKIITPDLLEAQSITPETERLLLKTANSSLWNNPGHKFNPDFVALTPESAEWVVNKGIKLVGIDYLSIQMFKDAESMTHRTLLEAGVIILEGLDLRKAYPGDYNLICLPIKLADSEGAPARAILISQ